MDKNTPKHVKKKKYKVDKKRLITVSVVALALVGGGGLAYHNFTQTHFDNGLVLFRQNVGNKSASQAANILLNNDSYYNIKERDEEREVAFRVQEYVSITPEAIKKNIEREAQNKPLRFSINKEKIKKNIIDTNFNKNAIAPRNAYVSRDAQLNWVIIPEKQGNTVDIDRLVDTMTKDLEQGNVRTISLKDFYKQPEIKKDDKKLKELLADKKEKSNAKITLTFENKDYPIPADTIKKAVTPVGVDSNVIKSWISTLDSKIGNAGKPYTFKTHSGKTVNVPNVGGYVWGVAPERTTKAVVDFLNTKQTEYTKSIPVTIGGKGYKEKEQLGGNYVEVDLNAQQAYIYKGGKMVFTWAVVTGSPNANNMTNVGLHTILYKESPSVLRGFNNDGTPYASPVNYWVPFNTEGEGIHDANWQAAFGGTRYQWAGSHGCVNTSPSDMARVWELTETGMPVVVWGDIYNAYM